MPSVADLSGFPCYEVEFKKDGSLHDGADLDGPIAFIKKNGLTDLFAISHGWNDDMNDARKLYKDFFAAMRNVLDGAQSPLEKGRKLGVLAILWPSKRFAEKALIPSGAAGASSSKSASLVIEHIDSLKGFFDSTGADGALEKAKDLVADLEDSAKAQRKFVRLIRSVLSASGDDPEGATDRFTSLEGDSLMARLKEPIVMLPAKQAGKGGAANLLGDAARKVQGAARSAGVAVVDAGKGMVAAAERLLNYTTYYQMKERAGIVGRGGVYQILRKIRDAKMNVRLHLVGHSFGGRLVTSAALGPAGQPAIKPESMTLLQAAFSHNGFAAKYDGTHDGFFRQVVAAKQVNGPILISHTANDKAVGIAYALASRISGVTGAALGDASDAFGGIGRNGAVKTKEAVFLELGPVGTAYEFAPGALYNLHADVISGHSDICKEPVGYALLAAVAKSGPKAKPAAAASAPRQTSRRSARRGVSPSR
jgi:hypothetical protein